MSVGEGQRSRKSLFEAGGLRIGRGEIGGKANGLVFFKAMLEAEYDPAQFPSIETGVPAFAVVGTDFFDAFLEQSALRDLDFSDRSDEEIARAFQRATLPEELVEGVSAILEETRRPLAVRSSSLMEDAIFRPFAGVYETKMIPNNESDPATRLRKVLEAIRFVYASTFFKAARNYIRGTDKSLADEKMAVIIQEVVGSRHGDRFYPLLSGVGRSFNFYPTGGSSPSDGVVILALGLGKTIVDGGICWSYSPARPKAPPPYGSVRDLLKGSQLDFWCVHMGTPQVDDPIAETEHLAKADLSVAESDGVLRLVASTYDPRCDRLVPGVGASGPRLLNFAPLLVNRVLPLNDLLKQLLAICEGAAGTAVEIEFALSVGADGNDRARLGFLQVRPMFVSNETVEIGDDEMHRPDLLLASERVMGNGCVEGIRDVVFVKPESFETRLTPTIAGELEAVNTSLLADGRPYLLVGFGRWGTSDPWLGIPVDWGQICGAKVIVEVTRPELDVEASQGAHFFHNISGNGVSYLSVHHAAVPGIDWEWLQSQPVTRETMHVRHASLPAPLEIRIDGRSGRGAVWHGQPRGDPSTE